MKKTVVFAVAALFVLSAGCTTASKSATPEPNLSQESSGPVDAGVIVSKIDALDEDFLMGADVSSLIAEEDSGVVYYGFDGTEQDPLKTMQEAGVNCIRVRVWVDPFDASGNGYGGGNCTIDTAIALGKRAATYGMKLLVDFHYSDFWADPGKQTIPKAWTNHDAAQLAEDVFAYTRDTIRAIRAAGIPLQISKARASCSGQTARSLCNCSRPRAKPQASPSARAKASLSRPCSSRARAGLSWSAHLESSISRAASV